MGWLDPTDSQLVQDDQDAETRCSDPQKNSYFQCPRQNMPLQEPGLGSDQQHSTNNQASLVDLQSIIDCHGGTTEHAENAADPSANQSNQRYAFEIYDARKRQIPQVSGSQFVNENCNSKPFTHSHPNSNSSCDQVSMQEPAPRPKDLADSSVYLLNESDRHLVPQPEQLAYTYLYIKENGCLVWIGTIKVDSEGDVFMEPEIYGESLRYLYIKKNGRLVYIGKLLLGNGSDASTESEVCSESGQHINSNAHSLVPQPEEQISLTDLYIQKNDCPVCIGKILVGNGIDVSTESEVCSESGQHINSNAHSLVPQPEEQQSLTDHSNAHSLVPQPEEQQSLTDLYIQKNGCPLWIGTVVVDNGGDISTESELCSQSGQHLTSRDAQSINLQPEGQQRYEITYSLPDGCLVSSGRDNSDNQVHLSMESEISGTSNLEEKLWVKLKKPRESLQQFLCKNWQEMIRHLPVPKPKKENRYDWQKKEPEDPEEKIKWKNAIKQKYWRVMRAPVNIFTNVKQEPVKIPTTVKEGKEWQQIFIARCKQTY
ncbi:uncharacterized protein [Penaeus vannamei]|uniref:uncharacterized protein n=1 Tax=Penaeus vannamei TaxID=6689 RepID=UPI00387FA68F